MICETNKDKKPFLKKVDFFIKKHKKWLDWLFFVVIVGLLSPAVHSFVLLINEQHFVCDVLYAEFCFFGILLLIDTMRNAMFHKDKLESVELAVLVFSLFLLLPGLLLYGHLVYNIYILNVDMFNSIVKNTVKIFTGWGLFLNWFSVFIKERV